MPAAPSAEAPDLRVLDERIHAAVNQGRTDEGRPALDWSADLAAVAQAHSADMAARGYFDHVSPDGASPQDRARSAGIACETPMGGGRTRIGVSENLYQTTRYARIRTRGTGPMAERTVEWFTLDEVTARTVEGWLDSPGHRRNLLDPASTRHGIGVALDGADRVLITQVLC